MPLQSAQQQLSPLDPEQFTPRESGYVVCREANGGYSISINHEHVYFESVAELDRFLDRSAWAARVSGEAHLNDAIARSLCPLHDQTGADAVRDFLGVLARLSPEEFSAYQRERAALQAELKLMQ